MMMMIKILTPAVMLHFYECTVDIMFDRLIMAPLTLFGICLCRKRSEHCKVLYVACVLSAQLSVEKKFRK